MIAMPAPLAQTVQLAFRLAFVWAGGFLLAVLVRAMLPDQVGVTIAAKQGPIFLSFSRIGFWTCVWAAVTVTVLVVIRSMVGDFGSASVR
jgi:hypothetical protein